MISSFPTKKPYNPGGYHSFRFTPAYLVTAFPMISNARAIVPLSFTAGNDWLQGYATTETLTYDEEPVNDGNGTYYNYTVAGFVPGDLADLIYLVSAMEKMRHIVLIRDTAGILRLVGSPAAPLDFIATYGSGAARTDQKGFNFKFTGSSLYRSPVYDV